MFCGTAPPSERLSPGRSNESLVKSQSATRQTAYAAREAVKSRSEMAAGIRVALATAQAACAWRSLGRSFGNRSFDGANPSAFQGLFRRAGPAPASTQSGRLPIRNYHALTRE